MKYYLLIAEAEKAAKVLLDKAEETGDISLAIAAAALKSGGIIKVYGRSTNEQD